MQEREQRAEEPSEREYVAEVSSNPAPTRAQWEAAVGKWRGRVDIRALLAYGTRKGWIGDH